MDKYLRYEDTKRLFDIIGADKFIARVDEEFKYGLYSMSLYWLEDSKYICKLKGLKGDVVISWVK